MLARRQAETKALAISVAAALAAFACRADAAITSVADGYFQCSEGPGQFSREDIGKFSSGNVMAGRIKVEAVGSDAQWAASAGLFFEGKGEETLGVAVSVNPEEPRSAYVQLIQLGAERKQIAVAKVPADSWVDVRAEMKDGILRVSGGGSSRQLKIGATQILRHSLHCQSGEFEVDLRKSATRISNAKARPTPKRRRLIHFQKPSRSGP